MAVCVYERICKNFLERKNCKTCQSGCQFFKEKRDNITNYDVISKMTIEELSYFLAIVELGDSSSISKLDKEDIDSWTNYLKEENGTLLIDTLREFLSKIK